LSNIHEAPPKTHCKKNPRRNSYERLDGGPLRATISVVMGNKHRGKATDVCGPSIFASFDLLSKESESDSNAFYFRAFVAMGFVKCSMGRRQARSSGSLAHNSE
jgi:hypothetical protein